MKIRKVKKLKMFILIQKAPQRTDLTLRVRQMANATSDSAMCAFIALQAYAGSAACLSTTYL